LNLTTYLNNFFLVINMEELIRKWNHKATLTLVSI
jgi:hypothetical protein